MNLDAMLAQPGVERIGWVLVHFVWQGAAAALLLAIGLWAARRGRANARHGMACAAMALMIVAPAATWMTVRPASVDTGAQMPPQSAAVRGAAEQVSRIAALMGVSGGGGSSGAGTRAADESHASATNATSEAGASDAASVDPGARLRGWLPWLVLGWMLGVTALAARQLTAWGMVQRLRRRWVKPVAARWEAMLAELAGRLGIARRVTLLESAVVEVPSLIGWLRPVVLLPASMATGLTPGQIEAILAHELAHVRRHDYLVNLGQTVVETLLFYHPAVWWVSRRIRIERENCCDDLAVETIGDAHGYALALTRMEELRTESSEFAMAVTGGDLMSRVRRLLGLQETETVGGGRWLAGLVACAVMLAACGTMMTAGTSEATAQSEDTPVTPPGQAEMVTADVKAMPGYLTFNAQEWVGNAQPTAEVTVNDTLLRIAMGAARGAQPDLAKTIDGINLKLVQVRYFESLDNEDAVRQRVDANVNAMLERNWMPVVRVPEEHVSVLMRADGNRIHGFAVIVADGDELVFANVVCDTEADKLGQELGGLLNRAMAGQLDLKQLGSILGVMAMGPNQGPGNNAGWEQPMTMAIEPDGFEATLEFEEMVTRDVEEVAMTSASGGRVVKMTSLASAAQTSMALEPGYYQAMVYMSPNGNEGDAVSLSVNGETPQRVYRGGTGLGPVGSPVVFDLAQADNVKFEVRTLETGMLLDRIELKRFRKVGTEAAPPGEVAATP